MIYKIILFYTLCCLYSVNCNLSKEEGADCEWEGLKGKCVNPRQCFTTLDEKSPKQPVCSEKGQDKIICCTDCELVNDTRNAVISPTSGIFWKNGHKAWDKCLEYLVELPYECHDSYYSKITRTLDQARKCHVYGMSGVGGPPAIGGEPRNQYPHMALLGYGDTLEAAKWNCGGSIISEKYILTVAHCLNNPASLGQVKFVAFGLLDRSKPVQEWQHVAVKRVVQHPEYQAPKYYHDIALIEVETPITFNKNVMPACLHFDTDARDGEAITTTWRDPEGEYSKIANTPSTLHLKKYSKTECDTVYPVARNLPRGFDDATHLCYGDKDAPEKACKGFSGEPLMITKHISHCFHTIIGVTSFGRSCNGNPPGYDVYTKVINYVPWIESVVWP